MRLSFLWVPERSRLFKHVRGVEGVGASRIGDFEQFRHFLVSGGHLLFMADCENSYIDLIGTARSAKLRRRIQQDVVLVNKKLIAR